MRHKVILLLFWVLSAGSCSQKETNHVDLYGINVEELKTLPDNFYGYRKGTVRITGQEYIIWFALDRNGNIKNVSSIGRPGVDIKESIRLYNVDTVDAKKTAQHFISLSRKYKFGHIAMDRKNKIAFSSRDGLAEGYVLPMNDSVRDAYEKNTRFRMLSNGWFENRELTASQ